jgi:hypothetical protein
MLVRAFCEIGTCAFAKAPIHEFDVPHGSLFPAQGFAAPALTLVISVQKGHRE